ncbi:MAG: DUF3341 domain-containing protein [Deltaproteobacteria bacterium]|nr:DUF3341 domain-containing protein [Deltaproteobacteria bacterium]
MQQSSGVLAMFQDSDALLKGGTELRERGLVGMDAFTPFPVHGVDQALGIKRSWVSAVTLLFGVLGCLGGLLLQIWTSAYAWPLNVGGKPLASVPAFIPIVFECTVLLGGVCTFFGVIGFCGLPRVARPPVDPRVTADSFALWVPVSAAAQRADVERIVKVAGAYEVRSG